MKRLLYTAIGLVLLTACSIRNDHSQKQATEWEDADSVATNDTMIVINPEDTTAWLEEEVFDIPEIPDEASTEVDEKAMEDYERMFKGKE
jgi:transaldolase